MKKLISEKVILLLIGIGIWALVLQNAGIIPTDKGVYVNGGNVSVSGNVNIVNTVDVNIKEVGDTSVTGGRGPFRGKGVLPVKIEKWKNS